VIYETTEYGYRVAPNQDFLRFGHRIRYNAQGLRNDEISLRPAAGVVRVLCVGDSVANGGAITDQGETISAQLEALLRAHWHNVEVLNGSAPGWAIGNELGWLRTQGTFGSDLVVLVISTHDLFQSLAPATTVDNHPSFPSARPVLALRELVARYLLPRLLSGVSTADPGAAGVEISEAQAARNRQDILAIKRLVEAQGGRLMVTFLEQAADNGNDPVTMGAKRQLFSLLSEQGIPMATVATAVENFGRDAMFRDQVHPNPNGDRIIAEAIAGRLLAVAGPQRPVEGSSGR
jgi:lysophospholipase L1-like esterase